MYSKIVLALAAVAAAQHAPTKQITGNAITRPLNEVVPACKAFTIEWTPSTPNSVSLVFLKGPSTNVAPFGPPIVVGIPNSGKYVWTPPAGLAASSGPTGYGIQLIDDVNGEFQYSTQFGISNAACGSASGSSSGYSVAPTSTKSGYAASSMKTSAVASASSMPYPVSNGTSAAPSSASAVTPTQVYPTPTDAVTSKLPQATGAAAALQAGLGMAGAVAAVAFML